MSDELPPLPEPVQGEDDDDPPDPWGCLKATAIVFVVAFAFFAVCVKRW